MSALFFIAAALIFGAIAIGAPLHNGLYWGLAAVAAGLFCWSIGWEGWTFPRR